LTNTLAADVFRSAGQALSDISFTLSNAPGTLGATSASGQFGNIDANGTVTYTRCDVQGSATFTSPTRWLGDQGLRSFSIVGNTITLESQCANRMEFTRAFAAALANSCDPDLAEQPKPRMGRAIGGCGERTGVFFAPVDRYGNLRLWRRSQSEFAGCDRATRVGHSTASIQKLANEAKPPNVRW
jgi:hypothetical protein